jgi:hypothetical protein
VEGGMERRGEKVEKSLFQRER